MENMEVKSNGHHIVAQALETALDNLVEKEDGKGLSSNDYTDAEKVKLAGIPVLDYTSLEEQIVPGEFWLGTDGVKRQVYFRTFRGMTPAVLPSNDQGKPYSHYFRLMSEPTTDHVAYVCGWVGHGQQGPHIQEASPDRYWRPQASGIGLLIWCYAASSYTNQPYCISLKYTKA